MPYQYVPGLNSIIDMELFDVVTMPSGTTIVGTYNFFGHTQGANGANVTNLQTANQLPQNWNYMEVKGFTVQFLSQANSIADMLSLMQAGYYTFSVAQQPMKFGPVSEFSNIAIITQDTAEMTTVVDTVAIHTHVSHVGCYIPLETGFSITIPSQFTFSFTLQLTANVAALYSQKVKVGMKGVLSQKIVG
jgi:hypothetical protein